MPTKTLEVSVTLPAPLAVSVSTTASPQVEVSRSDAIPIYSDGYTVTPGEKAITINCSGKRMSQDIIVSPIPSNYGRVEWNGVALRVS